MSAELPLFISCPHSGERLPLEANWLSNRDPITLLRDVDRFVDVFYRSICQELQIPFIFSPWTRYAIDLNRLSGDVDKTSVIESKNAPGTFTTGLHWVKTSRGETLMENPISQELHQILIETYYKPFHNAIEAQYLYHRFQGHKRIFHIDTHSMPSKGTEIHRDPGNYRKEIVISDQDGKSCDPKFRDLVVAAYRSAGFEVEMNWPYKGGRITQNYGRPDRGHHTIQVEINRSLYMNEETKDQLPGTFDEIKKRIEEAIGTISRELKSHVFLLN